MNPQGPHVTAALKFDKILADFFQRYTIDLFAFLEQAVVQNRRTASLPRTTQNP